MAAKDIKCNSYQHPQVYVYCINSCKQSTRVQSKIVSFPMSGDDIFSAKACVSHVVHESCKIVVSTISTRPSRYNCNQYVPSDKAVTKLCIGVKSTA